MVVVYHFYIYKFVCRKASGQNFYMYVLVSRGTQSKWSRGISGKTIGLRPPVLQDTFKTYIWWHGKKPQSRIYSITYVCIAGPYVTSYLYLHTNQTGLPVIGYIKASFLLKTARYNTYLCTKSHELPCA